MTMLKGLAFVADVARKRREASVGAPALIRQLKDHGVLPLLRPYLAPRLANA
jgi:hypothetical protein